jgi:hypothetical protein
MQAGLQGQQLGMQAQQLGMQNNQFAANYGLQGWQAQTGAQQAAQNANLGYLQMGQNLNQAQGNYMQQGFNNQVQNIGVQQATATNQQQYDQAAADRNYQYWQQQQNFPYQQLNWYSNLAHGLPAQGSVVGTQTGQQVQTTPNPSPWNIAAGALATGVGAYMGAAEGGLIEEPEPAYASGGLAAYA